MDPEAVGKVIGEKRTGAGRGQRVAIVVVPLILLILGSLLFWRACFSTSGSRFREEDDLPTT